MMLSTYYWNDQHCSSERPFLCSSIGYLVHSYSILVEYLPSANKVCEGYVFTPLCHSVDRGCLGPCPGAGDLPGGVQA